MIYLYLYIFKSVDKSIEFLPAVVPQHLHIMISQEPLRDEDVAKEAQQTFNSCNLTLQFISLHTCSVVILKLYSYFTVKTYACLGALTHCFRYFIYELGEQM